ncbi:hypothetical protein [Spirosoma pollinicola]|nr:hypothetical protein [Spirosoma pollinicola]
MQCILARVLPGAGIHPCLFMKASIRWQNNSVKRQRMLAFMNRHG